MKSMKHLIAVVMYMAVAANADPARVAASTIYSGFKEYRLALRDPDANVMRFFTRKIIESWSGELLVRRSPVELMDDVTANRSRYRFGELVYTVYAYDVSKADGHTAELSLLYRTKIKEHLQKLDITYVLEGGLWRIDHIKFALTRGERPNAVLDTFE
ncbi:MAG: hypothetical protein ACREVV_13625 [Steroidobacteraceae bacterium]